jgi:hypothetical protein
VIVDLARATVDLVPAVRANEAPAIVVLARVIAAPETMAPFRLTKP